MSALWQYACAISPYHGLVCSRTSAASGVNRAGFEDLLFMQFVITCSRNVLESEKEESFLITTI
jgi:hypothetical protein